MRRRLAQAARLASAPGRVCSAEQRGPRPTDPCHASAVSHDASEPVWRAQRVRKASGLACRGVARLHARTRRLSARTQLERPRHHDGPLRAEFERSRQRRGAEARVHRKLHFGHLQPRDPALPGDSTHTAELNTSRAIGRDIFRARRWKSAGILDCVTARLLPATAPRGPAFCRSPSSSVSLRWLALVVC